MEETIKALEEAVVILLREYVETAYNEGCTDDQIAGEIQGSLAPCSDFRKLYTVSMDDNGEISISEKKKKRRRSQEFDDRPSKKEANRAIVVPSVHPPKADVAP